MNDLFLENKKQALESLLTERENTFQNNPYFKALENFHSESGKVSLKSGCVHFEASYENQAQATQHLKDFGGWRKGPFSWGDIFIDSEWRSDFKWERMQIESLNNKKVLDIGCNNGYFMWRALLAGAQKVIGIDPVPQCKAQFEATKKLSPSDQLHFFLLGVEHLGFFKPDFDVIFHLGILYHHASPIQQMQSLYQTLKPGGCVYLETIGIPGEEDKWFLPEGRYAGMRKISYLPTLSALKSLARRSKFSVEVLSSKWEARNAQRTTEWCPKPSYASILDPKNPSLTIEGHPAPERFLLKLMRNDFQ